MSRTPNVASSSLQGGRRAARLGLSADAPLPNTPFDEVAGRSQIPPRSSLPQPCLLRNRHSPRREPLLGVHGVLIRLGSSKRAPVVKRIPCRFCKTPLTWPHRLAVRLALIRVLKAVVDGWETSPRASSVCVCNVPLMLSQRDGVDGPETAGFDVSLVNTLEHKMLARAS